MDMQNKLIFVIGPPRSGSTLLQRLLASHSQIVTHPEPHLISPLAHLGYFYNVDKAAYDHINAAQAIREFVADLPQGEEDYLDACRAYCDILYGRMLDKLGGCAYFLDKTPANALVLPFLHKLYPRARYIVLTRHPLAVLTSYAESFFEGDFEHALAFNDILGRYVPQMATFLRAQAGVVYHQRYEDLVDQPEDQLARIFAYLDLEHEPQAVQYGDHHHTEKSYGDPKVRQHKKPVTSSIDRWATILAADEKKRASAQKAVAQLDENDIKAWGYDKASLFAKVAEASDKKQKRDWRWMFNSYRLQRKIYLRLRKDIHQKRLGRVLKRVKYYCDVLLRE